jgi:hypothetical protein
MSGSNINIILISCRINQWKDSFIACNITKMFVQENTILLDKHQVTNKSGIKACSSNGDDSTG